MLYYMNIEKKEKAIYWLKSDDFIIKGVKGEEGKDDKTISFRPFGHHSMKKMLTEEQELQMAGCVAEASILERLSSLASAYYIVIGIFSGKCSNTFQTFTICDLAIISYLFAVTSGIYRALGPCTVEDWPYIPLSLAWALPVVYKRVVTGRVVFIDPRKKLKGQIIVEPLDQDEASTLAAHVSITWLASTLVPWMTVILAFYTPPVKYGCRSRYLSVFCGLWTLNNFIAYIFHIKREKYVTGNKYCHMWFAICGVFVVALFGFLVMLGGKPEWWIILGADCKKCCNCG